MSMFKEIITSLGAGIMGQTAVEHGLDNHRNTRRFYFWLPVISVLGGEVTETQAEVLAQKLYEEVNVDRIRPAAEVFAEVPEFRGMEWSNPVLRKVSFGYTREEMEFRLATLLEPIDPSVLQHYAGIIDLIDGSPYKFVGGEGPKRAVINDLLCLQWAQLVDSSSKPELTFRLNYKGSSLLKAMEIVFNSRVIRNSPDLLRAERYRAIIL